MRCKVWMPKGWRGVDPRYFIVPAPLLPTSPHKIDVESRQSPTVNTAAGTRVHTVDQPVSSEVSRRLQERERGGQWIPFAARSPEIHCPDVTQVLLQAVNQHAGSA